MQVQHCLCFHGTVALCRYREVSGGRQFTLFVRNHRSVVPPLCAMLIVWCTIVVSTIPGKHWAPYGVHNHKKKNWHPFYRYTANCSNCWVTIWNRGLWTFGSWGDFLSNTVLCTPTLKSMNTSWELPHRILCQIAILLCNTVWRSIEKMCKVVEILSLK